MVRSTDRPNMTIAVDWDIKQQTNQTNKISRIRGNGTKFARMVTLGHGED